MRCSGRQRGASLIEIMVSLVIGLFVVGAVMTTYLGTGTSGRQQSAASQMTEDAMIAFTLVGRDIQIAGSTDVNSIVATAGGGTAVFARPAVLARPIFGCEGSFTTATAAVTAATCAAGTASHAIEVSYQATTRTAAVTSGGLTTDCLGNTLSSTNVVGFGTLTFTSNRYYVDSGTGRPELYCASQDAAGSGGQPIVENVEFLKFWYGVAPAWNSSDPSTRRAVRYVTASNVADWNTVVSVRMCVLIRSADAVLTGEDSASYTDCDNTTQSSTDRRLRRAFFSTVALRNKVGF